MQELNVLEARHVIEDEPSLTVIEVLDDEYYDQFHLPNALNIPLDGNFESNVDEQVETKSGPIMVYSLDAKCDKARTAAKRLERMGFSRVYCFIGGKLEWKENGLPTAP